MKLKLRFFTFTILIGQILFAQHPVPSPDPSPDEIITSSASSKSKVAGWYKDSSMSDDFSNGYLEGWKWKRGYLNSWNDKGRTRWTSESKYVTVDNFWGGGVARIGHQWNDSNNTVNCGIISSQKDVMYPVFINANIRLANSALSSNFWLLTQSDQRREVDVVESYAGDYGRPYQAAANFHMFVGSSRVDYSNKRVYPNRSGQKWRNQFHKFSVYWRDPWNVMFYLDNEFIGHNFANLDLRNGIYRVNKDYWNYNEPMRIILDVEEHKNTFKDPVWRYRQGLNGVDKQMSVDYLHVWKYSWGKTSTPGDKITQMPPGIKPFPTQAQETKEISFYPNPAKRNDDIILRGTKKGQLLKFMDVNGKIISTFTIPHDYEVHMSVSNVSAGLYFIDIDNKVMKLIVE